MIWDILSACQISLELCTEESHSFIALNVVHGSGPCIPLKDRSPDVEDPQNDGHIQNAAPPLKARPREHDPVSEKWREECTASNADWLRIREVISKRELSTWQGALFSFSTEGCSIRNVRASGKLSPLVIASRIQAGELTFHLS